MFKQLRSLVLPIFLGSLIFVVGGNFSLAAEENAKVQINADGSKVIQSEEGMIQVFPDGTKIIKKADGTSIKIKPDGSKEIHEANGTTIQVPAKK